MVKIIRICPPVVDIQTEASKHDTPVSPECPKHGSRGEVFECRVPEGGGVVKLKHFCRVCQREGNYRPF